MDTTVVMQTISNPVTMVNEVPLDSLFVDMEQSIPEFITEEFDVQPDQILLPSSYYQIVPSDYITATTTTFSNNNTNTTIAYPVTVPQQSVSIPVSFATHHPTQIFVPIVYENVNVNGVVANNNSSGVMVPPQQPQQSEQTPEMYPSHASVVVAVAVNSPNHSAPVVSSSSSSSRKRRVSNDDSDYDSDAHASDYDSDLNIGSSPSHHSGDSGPVKKITKNKRRRSKDSKIKVERNRGACEKHKRDRKRCPLDCPNRTHIPDSPKRQQGKGSPIDNSDVSGKSPLVAPQSTSPSMPQSEASTMQPMAYIVEQQQQQQQQQQQIPIQVQQ